MKSVKFYHIKDEIRILGIDDSPFSFRDDSVFLVGCIFRGGQWLDGVLSTRVEVDGIDATEKIIDLVKKCKFKDLRIIMLDGLGFGGFNLVDIKKIFKETKLAVIVIVRQMPDFKEIKNALRHLDNKKFRLDCIKKAGIPKKIETKPEKFIYMQKCGIKLKDAEEIVKLSSTRSLIPEPIRVAHLIGSGIVLGESRGGA